MKMILTMLGKLYWLIVASIPPLMWYLFGTFQAPTECVDSRSCLNFFLPLDARCWTAVAIAACIVWPLCIRQILGNTETTRS